MSHIFIGKWITDGEFAALKPRDVFHRQLNRVDLPCDEHTNRHILFRSHISIDTLPSEAKIFISADDYYKLYVNGKFVAQGPAPCYHFSYGYNEIDLTDLLCEGDNTIAVHTLYQGLINRVWQSGDNRHGMILDLVCDGNTVLSSDDTFLTARHSAYRECGKCGYDTQFLEDYDSRAAECDFYLPDFDDSGWSKAKVAEYDDRTLVEQKSSMLVFDRIYPTSTSREGGTLTLDFGATYVGYLAVRAKGRNGDTVTVRCAQEIDDSGSPRYALRANCTYEERWILADGESLLDWFDYKSFRYATLDLPDGVEILDVYLNARHYPFELRARMREEYISNEKLRGIWKLCENTLHYGVQEVIQDCMEREKGFYLGDGCYTSLAHMILTGDDSMARKLIDDAFKTSFITDTLMTCMDCSFMQEIAEFPLILVFFVLWHYRLFGDREYLKENYPKVTSLLDAYKREYEHDSLLSEIDKWCVVEWPKNFRHDYDVEIPEGEVCHPPHVSPCAYYIEAVRCANKMADILGLEAYRDEKPLVDAFGAAFYDPDRLIVRDGVGTEHASLVAQSIAYAFGLLPTEESKRAFTDTIEREGISTLSLFCTFLTLMGHAREGRRDLITKALLDEGAWLRILREDGTTTFEGWGKDTKWNTSLFHLTMSYAAIFLADIDLDKLFA